jgi:bacterioferritin
VPLDGAHTDSGSAVQATRRRKWHLVCTCRGYPNEATDKAGSGKGESAMAATMTDRRSGHPVTRERLIHLLNEDLAREYQAIIAYVVYSQVLKGAAYMNIAQELEKHAAEELRHALIIAKQIDYLCGMPTVTPKQVKLSEAADDMLRFDLENENETIRNYRERVRQCEELGEFAMAELIRGILVNEQEHQIDLATALGKNVPDLTTAEERA